MKRTRGRVVDVTTLADLDPERFYFVAAGTVLEERVGMPYAVASKDSLTFCLNGGWRAFLPGSEWLVVGAITQAVEARGWGWTTRVLRGEEGEGYIGRVWVLIEGTDDVTYLGKEVADSASLALLRAYVAALLGGAS